MRQMNGVTEKGIRVGQDHQRAKLSNRDVELFRQMHEATIARQIIALKSRLLSATCRQHWPIAVRHAERQGAAVELSESLTVNRPEYVTRVVRVSFGSLFACTSLTARRAPR